MTKLFLQGIVVLASMSLVITPPIVSIPRVNGVTSSNTMSPTPSSLFRMAPWIAAPTATTSSGLTPDVYKRQVTMLRCLVVEAHLDVAL